jgi:hypothetical protein
MHPVTPRMEDEMLRRAIVVGFLAFGMPAFAAEVTYGNLPPGALSTNEVSDVSAEICRDHLFDPKLVPARLPTGYRLIAAQGADPPAMAGATCP